MVNTRFGAILNQKTSRGAESLMDFPLTHYNTEFSSISHSGTIDNVPLKDDNGVTLKTIAAYLGKPCATLVSSYKVHKVIMYCKLHSLYKLFTL